MVPGASTDSWFDANGSLVAKLNSTTFTPTSVAEFQFGAAPLNVRQSNLDAQRYTVSGGETLRSIARSFYGDDKLWYLIAQANGLSGSTQLSTGQTLSIPKLAASSNAADSFKPYDPSKVVGDLTPNLPMPQNDKGCGALGQIIMIVVAIVVTIYTAGAASELFASNIVSGAVGGAAGSIASQVVGNAIGAVDGFSWKAVAMGAISGGVSGGLNGVNLIGGDVGSFGNVLARAAVGNAMTQGIAVVTGLQRSFDWRGVAASAVGAGVGYGVGSALAEANTGAGAFNSLGDFGGRVARGALAGFAAGTAAAAMRGGRVSATQVATDAFGNALGGSIADAMMPQNSARESFRSSEIAEQNAQARSDMLYGLGSGDSGMGLRLGGGNGPGMRYGGLQAYGGATLGTDEQVGLNRAQEERLQSGQTITDYGDDYADGLGDTASSVGARRRAKGVGGTVAGNPSTTRTVIKAKPWLPDSPELGSKADYKARAAEREVNARKMIEFADSAEQAGNRSAAKQYRDMATGYETARHADLETARSITTYTKPMWEGVNPPEFKPSTNWSYMGQNSVGYVQGRGIFPDYVSISGSSHTLLGTVSTNLYDGTIAYGGGVQATNVDPGFRPSPSVSFGWIFGVNDAKGVTDFTTGSGTQFGVAIPTPWKLSPSIVINHSYGGAWALELGVVPRTPNTVFTYQPYGYAKELEK